MINRFALLLTRIAARIEPLLEADPDLRADVRALAEELLRAVDAATPEEAPTPVQAAEPVPPKVEEKVDAAPSPPPKTLVWSNDPVYAPEAESTSPFARIESTEIDDAGPADDELPRIERRCRIKVEACRWALERRERLEAGVEFALEIRPVDDALIARAKSIPDCFLWMAGKVEPQADNAADWEDLAEAFENLAEAAALLCVIIPYRDEERESYRVAVGLLAECQSAVREAAERVGAELPDADQDKAFHWLRRVTREERIFVDRHMRDSDCAEPAEWLARRERIEACDAAFNETRMRQKQTQRLFSHLTYNVNKLTAALAQERDRFVQKIMATVDELVATGLPPSNRELRDLLYPVLDLLPEGPEDATGYARTLDELHRYLDFVPVASHHEMADEVSPDIDEVRPLLAGRVVVLIGGDPRPDAADALKRAFDLAELDWVPSNKHQSYYEFRPHIAREEVAVVLLAIRWSSHSFANVKAFCDELGKPLVRLPAGYGANQVARQVIEQVAERLHA